VITDWVYNHPGILEALIARHYAPDAIFVMTTEEALATALWPQAVHASVITPDEIHRRAEAMRKKHLRMRSSLTPGSGEPCMGQIGAPDCPVR
jgi:hypothetical protein